MYRCSELVRLISSDEYLTAKPLEKLGIRLHLAMCRFCARYFRQLRGLSATVRGWDHSVPASEFEAAKTYILRQLSQKS
jgi:hypothetical protein